VHSAACALGADTQSLSCTAIVSRSCFFFQAEDGIRDFHVTGVQTCALPIFQYPKPLSIIKQLIEQSTDPNEGHIVLDFFAGSGRSEEHTSELQSRENLVCRLLLEKKKSIIKVTYTWRTTQPTDGHSQLSTRL